MLIITRPSAGELLFSAMVYVLPAILAISIYCPVRCPDQNRILNDKEFAWYISSSAGAERSK